jgi:hypothetical protein
MNKFLNPPIMHVDDSTMVHGPNLDRLTKAFIALCDYAYNGVELTSSQDQEIVAILKGLVNVRED